MKGPAEPEDGDAMSTGRSCIGTFRAIGRMKRHAEAVAIVAAGVAFLTFNSAAHSETVQYRTLSNEKDIPFLKFGKPPKKNAYKLAIKRWPDVRSCLIDSERTKKKPDIRKLDWTQLRNKEDGEVCIFRIFSSIGSLEGARNWVKSQGYRVEGIKSANFMKFVRERGNGKFFNSVIKIEKTVKEKQNVIRLAIIGKIYYSQSVGSVWLDDGKLIDVKIVLNSL